ncbi:MAG: hypothetical protein A2X94_03810 [Bdellovibrionales bacterium GWB1_55_8]|nr:MAG: hypothetical protein A2X94_03810 [Bdellovibrionales bacterium GWB1_55_8]
MKRLLNGLLPLLLLFPAAAEAAPQVARNGARGLSVSRPCEAGEQWIFTSEIPKEARDEFAAFIAGTGSVARSLSESISFRRDTLAGTGRSFADYWLSRTLLAAGLPHSAHAGFSAIALRKREPAEPPVLQFAALRCMATLVQRYTALELPNESSRRISELLSVFEDRFSRKALWETAGLLLKQQVQLERPKDEIRATVALLRGGGAYEAFSLGIWAGLEGDERGTAAEMERFLSLQSQLTSRVEALVPHEDQARLLAARAHYALKKYDQASRQLKLVAKSSNDLPYALSELAWSALADRKYGEAIGAAIALQSGGLRRVFAPETPMVLAMSMNELCQYPEALRAINQFRKDYEMSYRWLKEWRGKNNLAGHDLYPAAIAFLKKQKGVVPDRVASEWVRSPVFISAQAELNLLQDEALAVRRVNHAGAREKKRMAEGIRREGQVLVARLKSERANGKKASALKDEIRKFLANLVHYRRLQAAGPVWRALAANHESAGTELRKRATDRIARELARRSVRMLGGLEEVAENNRLIEVEIFDGASQDIIWQNAHPDYKGIVKKFSDDRSRAVAAKTWNWGKAPIGSDAWTEVWEDELGAFQSNLFNNCTNKDKYLAIKKSMVEKNRS